MPPSPQGPSDGIAVTMPSLETSQPNGGGGGEAQGLKKTQVELKDPAYNTFSEGDTPPVKRLEVLNDGYYYDVTDFISRHPGGDIIRLYVDSGEDATIAIQQFHYRSIDMVMARMQGLKKRPATDEESGLDPETKKRHDELTKDFLALTEELKAEGLMDPNPLRFALRIFQSFLIFLCGLAMSWFLGPISLIYRVISVLLMTLAGGQYLWLGHEGGHNAFTGNPRIDRVVQIFSYGVVFGLSASSWNSTHAEHHAMPQHETKDADLKTMPLIAFNKKVVRDPVKAKWFVWLRYQHFLSVLCNTFIVTLTWKFNLHLRYVIKNRCWFDLACMLCHYTLIPLIGVVDWMFVTWLGSIYILGNLILSHTHLPIVEEGKKLHWTEYALHHTTNIRSSWWVDWWTGHLNYQIEHHLFPTMPEYKGKLCRDRVKAFASKHDLPYHLCTYWEAMKMAYFNLEHVSKEIKHMM